MPDSPPPVEDPLDIRPFAGERACELLTAEQLEPLGYTEPGLLFPFAEPFEGCQWSTDEADTLDVLPVADRDVLADVYAEDRTGFEVFEPFEVAGYPGIQRRRSDLSALCEVTVATAVGQGVQIVLRERDRPPDEVCEHAVNAAAGALENLAPLPH